MSLQKGVFQCIQGQMINLKLCPHTGEDEVAQNLPVQNGVKV